MKLLSSFIILVSFVSIAVFGFAAMNHDSDQGHMGCIASTLQAANCPNGNKGLDMIIFHLNAFQKFSSATLSSNLLLIFAFLFALISGFIFNINSIVPPKPNFGRYSEYGAVSFWSPPKKSFLRWFSLHENSPSVS